MNESQVRKLFLIIQNTYNNFDYDDDKVTVWVDVLREVPFELAQMNLRRHVLAVKYPPVPAEIAAPEAKPEPMALYHDSLRDSAQQHIRQLEEWKRTAVGPPKEISEMMRLPAGERTEALRAYANRNRIS